MVTMTPFSWFWIGERRTTKSDGIALPNPLPGLNPGFMFATPTERVSSLGFPDFQVNTVFPERHSRKRWGTPEGEQEGETPGVFIIDAAVPFLYNHFIESIRSAINYEDRPVSQYRPLVKGKGGNYNEGKGSFLIDDSEPHSGYCRMCG